MLTLQERVKYGGALIAFSIGYAMFESLGGLEGNGRWVIPVALVVWPVVYLLGILLWALVVELAAALLKSWWHGADNFEVQLRIGKVEEENK